MNLEQGEKSRTRGEIKAGDINLGVISIYMAFESLSNHHEITGQDTGRRGKGPVPGILQYLKVQ